MNQINYFIELTRLKKPIGYMLLFWPCIWGLVIGYDFEKDLNDFLKFALLFLMGAILMRSAGCIVNDIVDKDFDKVVQRTKKRPIAAGNVSVKLAILYAIILCSLAFLVLIQFNFFTIILALLSMPLAFTYPLMKRFTYWPQLFLGITFNYGLLLGWSSTNTEISIIPLFFYIGAIFWTLGYDTIYGFQDIKDDEIIGVKSTSIKFKNNPKFFISFCYLIFSLCLIVTGYMMNFNSIFYIFLIFTLLHLFIFQIKRLDINSTEKCLDIFKSNNFIGMLVFVSLIFGKIV
jgi:4-hydroxybenzoate polyprenyl transferase|tara:strand:+ start:161 stop:1027 length:867 start_codon:yes stop_codon:yes gene_type:complete